MSGIVTMILIGTFDLFRHRAKPIWDWLQCTDKSDEWMHRYDLWWHLKEWATREPADDARNKRFGGAPSPKRGLAASQ